MFIYHNNSFLKRLGYEYICALLESVDSSYPFYKLLVKKKRWYEKKAFKLLNY